MEIRSRVAGSSVHVLRLVEDEPRVRLDDLPAEIGLPATFTEIVVTELHETGSRAVSGRRLAEYLALKGEARARLRDLLALLAKDLSQNAHRVPGAVEASEDVVAILALAERNLRGA
jgi:uncharacterized protein with von Willebrand factor type A (vWA) domain